MANHQWEKRYSFRLTDGDEELDKFLSKVPNNKRSELIRTLLRYAYRSMMKEQREQKQLHELKLQVEQLNELIKSSHQEILKKLESGIVMKDSTSSSEEEKEDENTMSKDAIEDSAMAILSTFGMSDDL